MITLRDYQNGMVEGSRRAFALGKRAPLVVAPTGSGKTVIFSYIAHNASQNKGKRVLILVHRNRLLRQTSSTLDSFGVPHGIIAAGVSGDISQMVQIASVQTLVKRMRKLTWWPDLILVDEAHHAVGKTTWGKVIAYYYNALIMGFTATPERLDGQGLGIEAGGLFDELVMGPQTSELTELGHLSKSVLYGAPEAIDTSQLHTRMGDWVKSEAAVAVDKPRITGNAVEHYKELSHNEPGIAFCASIRHAEHVAEEFRKAGYQSASIDGKMHVSKQNQMINDLGNNRLHVMTSCDLISEGVDVPVVSVGIMLRLTMSKALDMQQKGRMKRPFPGKERALIIDHVNNWTRHGFPDDDQTWTLAGKKRKARSVDDDDEEDIEVRQCDKCFHVHRKAPQCPLCGYVYPAAGRRGELEQVEGKLEQIDAEEIRKKRRQTMLKKAKTREELQEVAREFGYKDAWVEYTLVARQEAAARYRRKYRRSA